MTNSTFGLLSTAASGLAAARAGMDVTGQNIANVNTEGYTRQRVQTSALAPLRGADVLDSRFRVGSGVSIDGVSRLGDSLLERRVQAAVGASGFSKIETTVYGSLEAAVTEPSDNGLSASLASFWSSWQDVAAHPTDDSIRGVLLEEARGLMTRISGAATGVESTWSSVRADLADSVSEVNALATQFADLNRQINNANAVGSSTNELLDQQAQLASQLSQRLGSTLRRHDDGTADVLIGGNPLVMGFDARQLVVTGTSNPTAVDSDPVRVEWAHHPGVAAEIDGGEIGGRLAALSSAGDGGPLATQLAALNQLSTALVAQVNAVHQTGATRAGATGLDFFSLQSGVPAAHGIRLVPASVDDIAAATPATGGAGGQVADAIAQLGDAPDGPDAIWNRYVVALGTASRAATSRGTMADQAATGAQTALQSQSSVDLDEETVNLMTYQHAYQGAARVMTAVDEMLDTLINRVGLVGR